MTIILPHRHSDEMPVLGKVAQSYIETLLICNLFTWIKSNKCAKNNQDRPQMVMSKDQSQIY